MSDLRIADALRAAHSRSPMEAALLAELARRGWHPDVDDSARDYVLQYYGDEAPSELWRPPPYPYPRCGLALQARWTYATPATKYVRLAVLDFAFFAGPTGMIAVEVDGHDFHERTKEQARHDRSRDRGLMFEGWTVLRFTGSEVHQTVEMVVDQIDEAIRRADAEWP